MTYAIYIALGLAIFHFVYESLIAPALLTDIRYRLFALRDELRWIKITREDAFDGKHFRYLEDSINIVIDHLDKIDMMFFFDRDVQEDDELKKKIAERERILDDCSIEEARSIRKKALRLAVNAFLVNSGAILVVFFPVILLFVCFTTARDALKTKLKHLTATPELTASKRFQSIGI